MSDSEQTNEQEVSATHSKPPKGIKRFGIGSIMILQVLCALALLITINVLVHLYGKQIDLTRDSSFTLTEETKNNLSSTLIQKERETIKLIAIINPYQFNNLKQKTNEDVVARIHAKLQEYVDNSKGAIEVELVNPMIDIGRTQELSETYGYAFTESVIILDARPEHQASAERLVQLKKLNPKLKEEDIKAQFEEMVIGRHVRFLLAKDLFYQQTDAVYDRPFITGWKDETEITTNLMRAAEGKPKTIYFLFDKCRVDSKVKGEQAPPWMMVKNFYRNQNIDLKELRLANVDKIPEDADGIALIAPSVDFTDKEIEILNEYWQYRNKSSILITLDPDEKYLPKLYNYLYKSSGIRPNKDRIISKEDGQVLINPEVQFLPGPEVNGKLANTASTFDGASQSLKINISDNNKLVESFPLIKVAPGWWGETRFGRKNVSYDPAVDSPNPLVIAAAVTRGSLSNQVTAPLVSKMVVIGNSDFMSPVNRRQEQVTFMNQVGNWLVGREELMNIRQQANIPSKVFIAKGHESLLNKIFLVFLPAFTLLLTAFVWNLRRS